VLTAIFAVTSVLVFFEKEFTSIQPLVEDYEAEPETKNPMVGVLRAERIADCVEAPGTSAKWPLGQSQRLTLTRSVSDVLTAPWLYPGGFFAVLAAFQIEPGLMRLG
jgi:hypothetical protein